MEFSRQEYWSGLPFPPPGALPDPGVEPRFPASPSWQWILYQLSRLGRGFPAGSDSKESSRNSTPGSEDPLEEGMATHSSIFAWRIPMDRGVWRATIHGVAKNRDTTEWLSTAPGKPINLDYCHWKWFGGSGHTLEKICQRRHLLGHPSLSSAPVRFIELYHFVARLPDSTHHI